MDVVRRGAALPGRMLGLVLWPLLGSLLLWAVLGLLFWQQGMQALEHFTSLAPVNDFLVKWDLRWLASSVVFIVVVMFYEVCARYLFEKPTLWANEMSLWIAGFLFLLAGLYAMQQRSHIRIYIIYDIMPRWAQKTADCISVLLIWIFAVSLVWGGYNEARDKILRMEAFGTAWDPPIPATIKLGILVIITLVAIQALSNLIADWNKAPEHHSPADEIDETEIENIKATLREDTRNG